MRNRIARSGLAVAGVAGVLGLTLTAKDAGASDPCDLFPTNMTKLDWVANADRDVLCDINCASWPRNLSKPSAPVPSGSVPGFSFTNGSHSNCSFARGVCTTSTVCPPGTNKANVNGVYKCQSKSLKTVTFNPRQDCKNNVSPPPFKIDSLVGPPAAIPVSNSCRQTGGTTFYVQGTNVGLADSANVLHGAGARAVILAPDSSCFAPNCTRVWIDVDGSATVGDRGLELTMWRNRARSEKSFSIVPKRFSQCPNTSFGGVVSGGTRPANTGRVAGPAPVNPVVTPPRVTGRRFCVNGQPDTETSGLIVLSRQTALRLSTTLDTTHCNSAITNMTTGGKYFFRQPNSVGLGREVSFLDTGVELPAGTWELYLKEGQTTAGKYNVYW